MSDNEIEYWPPVSDQELSYLDEKSLHLPGWPGYRNRPGRSGLDYLDNEFELAHMEGRFIRVLFTGRLRTDRSAYLALMGFLAAFCLFLVSLPVIGILIGEYVYPIAWCYSTPPGALGVLLLWNLTINLLRRLEE